jgi:DMSO/TMAO reductase YedYZ molybdopterin-dependent catalytic subunit
VIAGLVAIVCGTGLGELLGALVPPSPVVAVAGAAVDLAPSWAKETAIAWFGTGDKVVLVIAIVVVLLAVGALAGRLQERRAPWGVVLVALVGVLGVAAAVTRPDAGTGAWLAPVVATLAAAVVLGVLLRADREEPDRAALSRRGFLVVAGSATAAGVLAAIGAGIATAASRTAAAVAQAFRLPAPARPAPPIPAAAALDVAGISPIITPNDAFYRVDTAFIVPQVADWELRIHGLVERELRLTWDELVALPLDEHVTTLLCVSNPIGGEYVGTARWLGYPIRELLARAGPLPEADMVLSTSADGWTASTPLEALTDPGRMAVLAIGMNGEPLPPEHGAPVRMVVAGLYGYVSATKWVVDFEVTRFDRATAYWTDRGWAPLGPVKLSSRIDVPRYASVLPVGSMPIAGVAWHQTVGIAAVEVQVDDGPWRPAELSEPINDDTWVQWHLDWDAEEGPHVVRVRATDRAGEVQTEDFRPVVPDGATGLHSVRFEVQ